MSEFQQRVIEEKRELDEKIQNIDAFLKTELFLSLPYAERLRINNQAWVMSLYSGILGDRIEAFGA